MLHKPKDHLLRKRLPQPTAHNLDLAEVEDLSHRQQLLKQLKGQLLHLMKDLKLQHQPCQRVRRIFSLLLSRLLKKFNHLSASRTWTLLRMLKHSLKASKKLHWCNKNLKHRSESKTWALLWLTLPAKALLLSRNKLLKHLSATRTWTL